MQGIGERFDELYQQTIDDWEGGGIAAQAAARAREYDPRLYGFPRGTLWPITVEDARAGRHRQGGVDWDAVLDDLSIGGTLDAHEESTPNNQTDDAGVRSR